ncbi:TVP38/TMEM64 family protein [Paucidesulfovibrio longus]|uniref:TVP38/TMEM64 family protein n=1 Tax=Paucidesulfovibrio longus TaxID=889 RepID=UPI0003B6012C|nr:TVP38/TMEM64 family protein [Paucidesulfovibrio longus]
MKRKKLVLLLFLIVAVSFFFILDLGRFLTLDVLKTNREVLTSFYIEHRLVTVLGFMLLYIIQTALSLPGATIFSLSAGLLFGAIMGTVYAVTAATIGAVLAFLVARYLFHDTVQRKFGSQMVKLNLALEREGLHYLLFLRLVPLFPFFLINLSAALTRLPLRTFFLGTMIGIIPGGFVYVNAGASLATINSLSDIASPRVLGSFALLGLFALVPVFYQRFKKKQPVRDS